VFSVGILIMTMLLMMLLPVADRLFHVLAAAMGNARSLMVRSRVGDTAKCRG